jgi:diguanylate cyclase (GGDEF)-like protein
MGSSERLDNSVQSDEEMRGEVKSKSANLRSSDGVSHVTVMVATVVTFSALAIFISLGARLATGSLPDELHVVFILNVALILFSWRRAKDLQDALEGRAAAETLASEIAYRDHTTGLANRRELGRLLDAAAAQLGGPRILLLLDLDHFKKVNDLSGHAAGDEVLKHVARNLQILSPEGSCCARLGGDEFAVLLPAGSLPVEADQLAASILKTSDQQVMFSGFTASTSASIGMCVVDEASSAEDALRRSDIAMYVAKRAGRNRAVWFNDEMELQLQARLELEREIRDGIDKGEFVPFFQPQIDLSTGALTGFEVLARWNSPTRGLVEPLVFIEVAEASGLIAPMSMSVMRQALAEARSWPSHLMVAVNISPVQFRDPALAERVLKIVTETNFPPKRLELEITESSIFEDQQQALATVQSLKNTGICISLDDFGTGYASLTQLQALPFDRIKIDKSFVANFLVDNQSNAIVSTIAALGRSLALPVTAEGVETDAARIELETLGCSSGQGWFFGRPMPADQLRTYLGVLPDTAQHSVEELVATTPERRDLARRASRRSAA